jgi:hypothetical protein
MLRIRAGGFNFIVGPSSEIEIRAGQLFATGQPQPLLRFEQGGWQHTSGRCTYIKGSPLLWMQFLDPSGSLGPRVGPRPGFLLSERLLFAGRERVAKFSPVSGRWTHLESGVEWPLVRITSR